MQVVVPWAYSFPSAPSSRPSAVPVLRPPWTILAIARKRPVLPWIGRTRFTLTYSVV